MQILCITPLQTARSVCFTMLLFFSISMGCKGQGKENSQPVTMPRIDSTDIPQQKQNINSISLDDDGLKFSDSTGRKIKGISHEEICSKNPYRLTGWYNINGQGILGDSIYYVDSLPAKIIKSTLTKVLKSVPNDIILKNVSIIQTSVTDVEYYSNSLFLVVTYALKIYDQNGMVSWNETTIHIYNQEGNLTHIIVDNHDIQGTYISADGNYLLANQILGRFGEGWSDVPINIVVYDVHKEKVLNNLPNIGGYCVTNVESAKYENGRFLIYASLLKEIETTENQVYIQLIIEPGNRILYHRKINKDMYGQEKYSLFPTEEALKEYELIHF